MRLNDKFAGAHLFYCLNAHSALTMEQLENAVFVQAADVWRRTGLEGDKALGLWINDALSRGFDSSKFAAELREAGLYCVSLNGFPFGVFHGQKVKKEVYRPDWEDVQRAEYTCRIADILSELLPEGEQGTISTLPVTYRLWAGAKKIRKSIKHIQQVAGHLCQLHQKTGKKIMLCLEPEPDCFLDLSPHAARWFNEELFAGDDTLREYIGVCLDTVHCGVLYENPHDSLRFFHEEGIAIGKVQIGAALSCMGNVQEKLRSFAEDTYLHQTRICEYGGIAVYPDLPQALAKGSADDAEWRVHFHIPLSWDGHDGLESTTTMIGREFLQAAYDAGCRHFESEIYTLDVFPEKISTNEMLAGDLHLLRFLMGSHI